jgi:hypothetical protein
LKERSEEKKGNYVAFLGEGEQEKENQGALNYTIFTGCGVCIIQKHGRV